LIDVFDRVFGGNCKTTFILTLTDQTNHLITKECFEFGQKVKKIKNEPKPNNEIPNEILENSMEKNKKKKMKK